MRRTVAAATAAGVALAGVVGLGVAAAATGNGPGARIADVLTKLVDDGTLTQKQADAVADALTEAREKAQAEQKAQAQDRSEEIEALLQKTLGLSTAEVRQQLAAGKTLKEIAGDNAKALADGAVALVKKHADEAVAEDRISQDQADRLVAQAQERADAWLAGDDEVGRGLGLLFGLGMGRGMGPGGMMGLGGMGHHGWGGDSDDDPTDAPGASASTGVAST